MKRMLPVVLLVFLLLAVPARAAALREEIYDIINTFYIDGDRVDWEKLRGAELSELSRVLGDPQAGYFPPDDFRAFMESYLGVYGGVGLVLSQEEGLAVIREVFPGTPAGQAGLRPGDIIVAVDGVPVRGLSLDEVVRLIRGLPGTGVKLEVQREGRLLVHSLVREEVRPPTVAAALLGEVGYLAIYSFNDQTPAQFREALAGLRAHNPRGFILDLRDNPGGLLEAAREVAAELLPAGPVVALRGRSGSETIFYNERGAAPLPNLVVLVNGGSASAAEILAGAIEDYGVGVLLGEPTFGKASVQTVFVLSDGSGLKITTGRYYTPRGRSVNGTGLLPAIAVPSRAGQLDAALAQIRAAGSTLIYTVGSHTARRGGAKLALGGKPYLEGGRVFVPLRELAEALGAAVFWDSASGTATLRPAGRKIKIAAGRLRGEQDGEAFELGGRAVLRGGRLFVPVRAVAEALGGRVRWHGSRGEIIVTWTP